MTIWSDRTGSAMASTSWTVWNDESTGSNVIQRSSAAQAFLYAANQQRSTLTVLHDHKVLKVNFDANIKATGIQFGPANGGTIMTATANKEVLLAAGSLATPPILEHSGVGDSSILSKFGITTLVDLPAVGRNLQDQPGTGVSALVQAANATNSLLIDNVNLFAPVISLVDIEQVFGALPLLRARICSLAFRPGLRRSGRWCHGIFGQRAGDLPGADEVGHRAEDADC
ncbi:GMC oxidoreductase-domain-containing protein [Schizophyllum amplum]|uniref:GMC oxidoreductase-domain-containing protein n=1 Tax=Schizophyllum amplum TaxID=97359 RepID=A0A550BWL4_9AGAR|nr:GMC oxidoreductase-domain-containing protein [Auriculariopsis ampla]